MSLDRVNGGGSVERTLQLTRHLLKAGVECRLVATDTGLVPDSIRDLEESVTALPTMMERFYVPRFSHRVLKECVAAADVVHLMNHWTVLNALVFHYCRYLRKPYVVCPAGALPTVHGRSRAIKRLYNALVGRRIIREASAAVAISPLEIADFRSYGVRDELITVIPNGIDPEEFTEQDDEGFRREHGMPGEPFILFVGRLDFIKGPDLLLEAYMQAVRMEGLPHHLVLAGPDGGMLHELQRSCESAGFEKRVHFTGYIGGRERSRAYHAAAFLAIPSRREAMSIVVLEAGITGTPALITRQCGFDGIAPAGGGIVVEATVEGLREGLTSMVKAPRGLAAMGRNLERFARENFLWDYIAKRYLELFEGIVRR